MARRWPLAAVATLLAAGAVVLVVADRAGDDGADASRAGSRRLSDGPPVGIDQVPLSYRVEYRVELSGVPASGERITVRRPFESRRETYGTTDLDGRPESVEVAAFGRLRLASRAGAPSVIAVPPGPPPPDLRLDAVLDAALADDRLERRERREVGGRPCQVYRSRGPLLAGELEPPTLADHVDTCVDRAGLVLEEVVVTAGERTSRRLATVVDPEPRLRRGLFATGPQTVPGREGGGSVVEVAHDSAPPGAFWDLGALPRGLERWGRYAVVPPQVEAFTDPRERARRLGAVVDVLVDGPDVVLVERGGTLGNVDVIPDRAGARRVALGPVGDGQLLLAGHGAALEVDLGDGRYVRVAGTAGLDRLTAVARGLHEVEGSDLRVIGDAGG